LTSQVGRAGCDECADGGSTPDITISSIPGAFDFRHACEHHDGCDKGFTRNGKPTYWVSRSQRGSWFLYDMQASCRWQHGENPSTTRGGRDCRQGGSNYPYAVRTHAARAHLGPDDD
jgi:hypothetical protein